MAQDGSTHDGPDRAPRSPWARSGLPRSPWQPEGVGSVESPTDGPGNVVGPPGPPRLGDVIDLAAPDDGGYIDLVDPARSPGIEVVADDGAWPGAPRASRRVDAFGAALFGAARGRLRQSRRGRTQRPVADRPGMAIIDLGDKYGDVVTEDVPLGSTQWRRIEWHTRLRPVAVVIVVVAALLVGGSVAPRLSPLPRLANITVPLGATLAVEGTRALVLGSRDGVGESVAAYNVAGGAREWFTELPIRQSDDIGMTVADGVVIVSGGRLGNRGPHTIVVDEKTGRRLWSSAQDLMSPRRGSDTLLVSGGPTEFMARDKRTGAPRWNLSLMPGCSVDLAVPAAPEAPTALIELCLRQAQLRRINLDTGTPEITRSVAMNAATDDITMFTVDDVVVVEDAGVKPPAFDTYNLSDLTKIWRTRGAATENVGSYPCGVEICESAGGSTVILDAHSGAVIPTTGHEAELSSILQPFIPRSAVGTLLLAAPGAVLPVVNRTTYVADFVGEDAVMPVPLFRPGRTWIVTLSPAGVRQAVQLLDGPAADVCRPIGSYLGCMTAKLTMTFWPLPKIQ